MGDSKPPRVRRKSAQGDHVKHRRTRSGCYTCRTRRVKCDEGQPSCERCRKGGRECAYPDPPTTKSSARRKSKADSASKPAAESVSNSSDSEGDDDDEEDLSAIPDEEDGLDELGATKDAASNRSNSERQSPGRRSSTSTRKDSNTPSLTQEKSPASSTDGSLNYPGSLSSGWSSRTPRQHLEDSSNALVAGSVKTLDWSHLPSDLQFYLDYHQKYITHYTYSFRHDAGYFLRTTLIGLALRHKPLLYAVVGFSAFQHTLTKPDGKLQDFLGYYTTSVSHLRASLASSRPHTIATLLTILQLATVEEYLGDWVNLKSHQKAAYKILTELFTPQTVMQSDMHRVIFDWYSRFDLFAGFLAGSETVLDRHWFVAYHQYYLDNVQRHPDDLVAKMDEAISNYRLLAMELMILFANREKEGVAEADFMRAITSLLSRFQAWRDEMDPALTDSAHRVTDFGGARERDPDDIVDPCTPGVLFGGQLWRMNYAMMGWCSTDIMIKLQFAKTAGKAPPADLTKLAREVCQMYEAIEYWPGTPRGSLISAHPSLGVAVLILPKDERHTMWFRRKFAMVETMGYIFAPSFRNKMATLWGLPEIQHWWLPSDESCPRIVRSIRSFVDDRAMAPQDADSSDLKEMKGVFRAMKLHDDDDGSSPTIQEDQRQHPMDLDSVDIDQHLTDVNQMLDHSKSLVFSASPDIWDMPTSQDGTAFLDHTAA